MSRRGKPLLDICQTPKARCLRPPKGRQRAQGFQNFQGFQDFQVVQDFRSFQITWSAWKTWLPAAGAASEAASHRCRAASIMQKYKNKFCYASPFWS